MSNTDEAQQISSKEGFIAALDQGGGSTLGALRLYSIADADLGGDYKMDRLMHEMRVRITSRWPFPETR